MHGHGIRPTITCSSSIEVLIIAILITEKLGLHDPKTQTTKYRETFQEPN